MYLNKSKTFHANIYACAHCHIFLCVYPWSPLDLNMFRHTA